MNKEQLKTGNWLNKEIINVRKFMTSAKELKTITLSAGEGEKLIFSAIDNEECVDGMSKIRDNCIIAITDIMHEYEKNLIKEFNDL